MPRAAFLSAALLVLLAARAAGAVGPWVAPGWHLDHWTLADGLPVNGLSALAQTPDGYVWIATADGLVRFDGVRFEVFGTGTHALFPSDRFTTLALAPDGRLFAATAQHHLLSWKDGGFTLHGRADGMPDERVFGLVADASGVWIGTGRGLARYAAGRIEPVAADRVRERVLSATADADGTVWIGTERAGLLRLRDGVVEAMPALPDAPVYTLHRDQAGRLWVGTGDGLFVLAHDELRRADEPGDCAVVSVFAVQEDPRGRLWAGTSCGVWHLRGQPPRGNVRGGSVRVPVAVAPGGEVVLRSGRSVLVEDVPVLKFPEEPTAHLVDQEGGVWVATATGNLYRVRRHELGRLPAAICDAYSVIADRGGDFWVACEDRGVLRIRGDRLVQQFGEQEGLTALHAWVVSEAPDGSVWIGTNALCRVDGDRCVREGLAAGLGDGGVRAIYFDRQGRGWIGSRDGLFRREVDGRIHEVGQPLGLGDALVRVIHEGADGTVWLGTDGSGLFRIDGDRARPVALPSSLVRDLHEDAAGHLWIATETRGLLRLDPRTGAVAVVGKPAGLPDDGIHRILDDGLGHYWLSSNYGIFRVARAELVDLVEGRRDRVRVVRYAEREGMAHREANGGTQWAGIRTRDGRLVFPTQSGVAVIEPARMAPDPAPPPVHVESLTAGGAVLDPRHPPALAPDQRDFAIAYTAIAFDDPQALRFRYRLEGFDEDWVDAGARRQAFYTRVPPGRYRFRVAAAGRHGLWNEAGATIDLVVTPRFSETGWFRALLALAGLLVVASLVRLRFARLRARQRELSGLVAQRTAELLREKANAEAAREQIARQAEALRDLDEVKSRFFAHINHELRTPLTLIAGPVQALLDGDDVPDRLRPSLEAMGRNARRLRRLTDQILDLERAQAGKSHVDPQPLDLTALAERTLAAFRPVVPARAFELAAPGPVAALADAEQMETVLTNLVSNAVKFTGDGGHITVRTALAGGRATLEVEDDGVGIPAEDLPRVFDRFYRVESPRLRNGEGSGLGLALVRELVQLQGGAVTAESRLGEGTCFRVVLPLAGEAPLPLTSTGARAADEASLLVAPAVRDSEPDVDDPRPTVLVVDDNPDLRRFVSDLLERDYRVLQAVDGDAGLALAREVLPDLLVSDVMMPGIDGFELSRRLAADPETEIIPVLLLTARATSADEARGLRGGAVDYLVKPFDVDVLRARVEGILRRRTRLREALRAAATAPSVAAPSEVEAAPVEVAAVEAAAVEPTTADRATAHILEHLDDEALAVPTLARALGMSIATLKRRLEDEGAPSPGALIRNVRLERGRALLMEGAGNVSEVALAVGYNSLAQFSRRFKEAYGVSPSQVIPRN